MERSAGTGIQRSVAEGEFHPQSAHQGDDRLRCHRYIEIVPERPVVDAFLDARFEVAAERLEPGPAVASEFRIPLRGGPVLESERPGECVRVARIERFVEEGAEPSETGLRPCVSGDPSARGAISGGRRIDQQRGPILVIVSEHPRRRANSSRDVAHRHSGHPLLGSAGCGSTDDLKPAVGLSVEHVDRIRSGWWFRYVYCGTYSRAARATGAPRT